MMAGIRSNVLAIVEGTFGKPELEKVEREYTMNPAEVAEVEARNKIRLEKWQTEKDAKVADLLSGGEMNSFEVTAYLDTVAREERPRGELELQQWRRNKLEGFKLQRVEIGRANTYRDHEEDPIEQRPMPISERELKFDGIKLEAAKRAFADGWDEIKNASRK
jgi:hypothetical protein